MNFVAFAPIRSTSNPYHIHIIRFLLFWLLLPFCFSYSNMFVQRLPVLSRSRGLVPTTNLSLLERFTSFRRFLSRSSANNKETTALLSGMKPKIIFVLGGPGAGKGTQCEMIAKEFGIAHLSAGELLRREQNSGSENGKLIDSFLRDGKIVPVALSLALLKQEILGREEQRYLIDGFPRNHDNLQGWLAAMPEACELEAVVCVTCPEEVLERRILQRGLTSNRTDDNLETLRKRFATYRRDSLPVIDWFRRAAGSGNFSFLHIDGDLPREAVYRQIRQQLLPVLRTELAQLAERFFRLLGQGRGPELAAFLVRPDGCELSPAAVERVAAEESALFRRVGGRPWTSIEVTVDGRDARSVSEWAEQGVRSEKRWKYLRGRWRLVADELPAEAGGSREGPRGAEESGRAGSM